jgi:putative oxidoreductase
MQKAARESLALLVMRVVFGVGMALHGWPKIQNPLHWMDKAATPAPAALQALAALAEFGGGIGIALGLFTQLSAAGIAATMSVALYTHLARGDSFVRPGGKSYEAALLYLSVMIALLLVGPGQHALDARRKRRLP